MRLQDMSRLLPFVLLLGLLACNEHPTSGRCRPLEGEVGLAFKKGVTQTVAVAFLDSVNLPRLDEDIEDGCYASIRVLGGDRVAVEVVGDLGGRLLTAAPRTFLLIERDSLGYRFGAIFHGTTPEGALAIIGAIPGLAAEYVEWSDKTAVVAVPDGTEEEWIVRLQEYDCIREARRLSWCPV